MSNLPSRFGDALDALSGREVSIGRRPAPVRVQRAVHQAVAVEHGRGIVQAARVRAVEYVATEAMQAVAGLTELETLYIQRAPLGEGPQGGRVPDAGRTLPELPPGLWGRLPAPHL